MDKNVQGTNDFSTLSKFSMVKQGYFTDEFIHEFVSHAKPSRRSPIIHMGYYVRAEIIEATLKLFIELVGTPHAQIISCGAGYDTTYFRLKRNLKENFKLDYYEIDFEDVVSQKYDCIIRSAKLNAVLELSNDERPSHSNIISNGYHLLAADLRCQNEVENTLSRAGISWSIPTLLLAECSITYMDETSSSNLIKWASSKFLHATFVTFEQIQPDDGFGLVMKQHFEALGSPLLSLDMYPNLQSQRRRYKNCGWSACVARSAYEALQLFTEREKVNTILRLEPFDEFESWHLMCCHYTLTIASQGELEDWCGDVLRLETINLPENLLCIRENELQWTLKLTNGRAPERYAHVSGRLDDFHVALVGGFGKNEFQEHSRLSDISIVNISNFDVVVISLPLDDTECELAVDAMHSTCSSLPDGRLLLIGGRTSPKRPVNTLPVLFSVWNKSFQVLQATGPCARWRHTATLFADDPTTTSVFIYGGRTSDLTVLSDMWQLNIPSSKYTKICYSSYKSPCARFSHSAVSLVKDAHHSILISGGLDKFIQPLNDVWKFHIEDQSWKKIHINGPQMLPRYSHTSEITSDKKFLLLLGGVNTYTEWQPGLCVINVMEGKCFEYALPVQNPEYPIMLHNHTSQLIEDTTLLVFGGGDNCFSFGTSFNPGILSMHVSHLLH